ncbi:MULTISPECIES: hypothetical protein [Dehalobacter]|jgi:hypothetical protein|uniref:Uncharacterized protein n=1 Tax=Dehalobacter restrictus (strain DSM 9455 / PER-K23) TaxID=871738 RepID=A0ABN4BWX9_DEHRP|nr:MULTISPECIES: hypothetical protein [Dehalobacter]AHF11495.1 hypothetical protein DEHRE_13905 [Dehalobacter restrictus DSM 9455]MCG1024719.1 hypothetical protein [Dehalobacter sp.]MDJ0305167.1 hypothetical protein [Dehalobacter sp.]OCZ53885.1 hypothetical protein A7D23_06190 [Dehalobacter sp. TeCB1]
MPKMFSQKFIAVVLTLIFTLSIPCFASAQTVDTSSKHAVLTQDQVTQLVEDYSKTKDRKVLKKYGLDPNEGLALIVEKDTTTSTNSLESSDPVKSLASLPLSGVRGYVTGGMTHSGRTVNCNITAHFFIDMVSYAEWAATFYYVNPNLELEIPLVTRANTLWFNPSVSQFLDQVSTTVSSGGYYTATFGGIAMGRYANYELIQLVDLSPVYVN